MRTKHFLVILCSVVIVSVILILFGQQRPATIQNIVSSTHQQLRNFKVSRIQLFWLLFNIASLQETLRDAEAKTLVADEKYMTFLGFTESPRLYPKNVWTNTSLPVIVTYVIKGQESQAVGLISNVAKVLPNNTILIYDLGLGNYALKLVCTC